VNFIFFKSKLFTYLIVILIITSEMVQIFFPRHFTFDWIDVGAAILAVALSYLTLKNQLV